jgi:molybdopterin molybdotransferase
MPAIGSTTTVIRSAGVPGSVPQQGCIPWSEARHVSYGSANPLPPVAVPLAEAIGRTLSRDVTALQDLPHYASSAMDGWAVNGPGPWLLAGSGQHTSLPREGNRFLPANSAAVIATGGLVPHGADAVLRKESGLAARDANGVAVVLTGAEVVTQGVPAPGQVRDTFGPQLGNVVSLLGGVAGVPQRIGDSLGSWLDALDSPVVPAGAADVIITTGGTGKSGTDHFRAAIDALGGQLLVDGIAMRPGHPAVLAGLPDGRFVIGLPGNPLAAVMALLTIGAPLIASLGGAQPPPLQLVMSGCDLEGDPEGPGWSPAGSCPALRSRSSTPGPA